jgi:hypothetical protein
MEEIKKKRETTIKTSNQKNENYQKNCIERKWRVLHKLCCRRRT